MKIITIPDKRLKKRSKKLKPEQIIDKQNHNFIEELIEIMKQDHGIGIAAPQVGKNIRIIIVETEDGPTVFINPRILWRSIGREMDEEGCLSIPNIYGIVKRAKKVRVNYLDRDGNKQKVTARGLFARVLQHEIDHLNGILFTDRMIKQTQGKKAKKQ